VRRLATYVPPLLVGLLALPFIQRQNSFWEWSNAYWLLERQTEHVAAHLLPTFFLHQASGSFNPFFVFYGGPMFALLAYPAALLGAWPVFAGSVVLAIVAGYLGTWWTARNLGLSPQLAVLPALTFTTTPYVLSEIYGRGAWAELVAVNAMPVVVGGMTSLLWRPGRRRGPALAALVAAGFVIPATHNLTLLMAAILLPLIVATLLPLRRAGLRHALPGVAALAVGAGLTAPWLIPNLWDGRQAWGAQEEGTDPEFTNLHGQVELANVLSPVPRIPDEFAGRWVYDQAPALAMAWALVAFLVVFWLHRRAPGHYAATAAGLVVVGVGVLVLIVHPTWWLHFPLTLKAIQFPFRLIPYVALVGALGVAVALVGLRGWAGRVLVVALVAIVASQVRGALTVIDAGEARPSQIGQATSDNVVAAGEPSGFAGPTVLVQYQFRVVKHPTGSANAAPVPVKIRDPLTSDRATLGGVGRVGQRSVIPVVWSRVVHITGDARLADRDPDGLAIVEVTHVDGAGRWRAEVARGRPWQLVLGQVVALLSALAIAAAVVADGRRRLGAQAHGAEERQAGEDERGHQRPQRDVGRQRVRLPRPSAPARKAGTRKARTRKARSPRPGPTARRVTSSAASSDLAAKGTSSNPVPVADSPLTTWR
jgi:hypothetical protein